MVVDSSVWLEILSDGPLGAKCERFIKGEPVQVSSLSLYEIYKKLKVKSSEEVALEAISYLSQFEIIDINREISLLAADCSLEYRLAMADSLLLASAQHLNTKFVTLDNDFAGIPGAIVLRA